MIDMFGEVGGDGSVVGLLGEWEMEGTRDDNITPYSVTYL